MPMAVTQEVATLAFVAYRRITPTTVAEMQTMRASGVIVATWASLNAAVRVVVIWVVVTRLAQRRQHHRQHQRQRQRHRQHQILAVAVEGAGATKKAIQIIAAATPVAKEGPALFPRGWIHGAAKPAAQGSPHKVNTDGVRHMKGSRGLQLRHLPKRTKNIQRRFSSRRMVAQVDMSKLENWGQTRVVVDWKVAAIVMDPKRVIP